MGGGREKRREKEDKTVGWGEEEKRGETRTRREMVKFCTILVENGREKKGLMNFTQYTSKEWAGQIKNYIHTS